MSQVKTPQGPDNGAGASVDYELLDRLVRVLQAIPHNDRERYLQAALHLAALAPTAHPSARAQAGLPFPESVGAGERTPYSFSEDRSPTLKEFFATKKPRNESERLACSLYYLVHFKKQQTVYLQDLFQGTLDLGATKFSNPTGAVEKAVVSGFVVRPTKSTLELSSAGEVFVQNLPDRAKAYEEARELNTRSNRRSE